jgi:hypothetical protein
MKPHKHAEMIKLMADGVRIECCISDGFIWRLADWDDFNGGYLQFRVAPNQPADEEGWIPWFGGENPAVGKRVDIEFREDSKPYSKGVGSEDFRWAHQNNNGDIVAYRTHKQKVKKWRWMFFYPAPIQPSSIYVSEPFTEDEAAKYFADSVRQRVVPEWKMEVECDE